MHHKPPRISKPNHVHPNSSHVKYKPKRLKPNQVPHPKSNQPAQKDRKHPASGDWKSHTSTPKAPLFEANLKIPLEMFRKAPYFFVALKKLPRSDLKDHLEQEIRRKVHKFHLRENQKSNFQEDLEEKNNFDRMFQEFQLKAQISSKFTSHPLSESTKIQGKGSVKIDNEEDFVKASVPIPHPVNSIDITQLFSAKKAEITKIPVIEIWKESESYFKSDLYLFNAAFELAIKKRSTKEMRFLISKWEASELSSQAIDIRMKTNILIYGLASNPNLEFKDFAQYPTLDSLGYKRVLSWLASTKTPADVVKFFRLLMQKHDVKLHEYDAHSVLQIIGRDLREPDLAWALLENFTRVFNKDTKSFNIIIASYCNNGQTSIAEGLFNQMGRTTAAPDTTTYNTLIQTFSNMGDRPKVQHYCSLLKKSGLSWSIHTYTIIGKYFANIGEYEAYSFFFKPNHLQFENKLNFS